MAKECRSELLANGIATKILPEAYSWHFAGAWDHIPSLNNLSNHQLRKTLEPSHELLSRAVSLPIVVNMDPDTPIRIRVSLEHALASNT